MIKRAVTIFFLVYMLHVCVKANCETKGYYWRDYTGTIPSDAVPGGTDVNGKPIYIGQIFSVHHFLLPAKIYVNESIAHYAYGDKAYKATQFIKILCSKHPEHFEWIRTNNEEIKFLTHEYLIPGGYRQQSTIYIGRIREDGEITVGKVIADDDKYAGLYIAIGNKGIRHKSFDVLSYNPHYRTIDIITVKK